MSQPNPDSLIFDMDGTLWDAVQTYSDAWNLYFKRNDFKMETSKKELNGLMGLEEAGFFYISPPKQRKGPPYQNRPSLELKVWLESR